MDNGIGMRYNERYARIIGVEHTPEGLTLTGLATGRPDDCIEAFMKNREVPFVDTGVAIGLSPGNFIMSCICGNNGMDSGSIRDALRWETERKIISDPSDYNIDCILTEDAGFMFAGRRDLIDMVSSLLSIAEPNPSNIFTDVEPIAVYNGLMTSAAIGIEPVMVSVVEPDGLTTMVVNDRSVIYMESIPIQEKELYGVLPPSGASGGFDEDNEITQRLTGYIRDSYDRMAKKVAAAEKKVPSSMLISGAGVYAGDLVGSASREMGMDCEVFNPFMSLVVDVPLNQQALAEYGAAFVSCLGLALRAMEG